jgi:DNA-binding MarR family transcriptional regulator/GNAT superfamily N-acetyltransferase
MAMAAIRQRDQRIDAVRGFNRFYTRQIGVLRKTFLDSPYSLGEARVLYEVASRDAPTASDVGRALDLDAGYLSRLLRNFEKRGLIKRKVSARDARQSHLALSPRGHAVYVSLDQRSQRDMAAMLGKLKPAEQARLVAAMQTIETLLGGETPSAPKATYILRAPRPGDFGWIVRCNAEIYAAEYGWHEPFEGVCAQIVADFVNKFDPKWERCWIAEIGGDTIGCIFVAKDSDTVARIRLLIVEPKARGLGLGARLVDECIGFARGAGYKKMTLWTHSVLTAARHIYEKAGFKLQRTEQHSDWGPAVISEHWDLDL